MEGDFVATNSIVFCFAFLLCSWQLLALSLQVIGIFIFLYKSVQWFDTNAIRCSRTFVSRDLFDFMNEINRYIQWFSIVDIWNMNHDKKWTINILAASSFIYIAYHSTKVEIIINKLTAEPKEKRSIFTLIGMMCDFVSFFIGFLWSLCYDMNIVWPLTQRKHTQFKVWAIKLSPYRHVIWFGNFYRLFLVLTANNNKIINMLLLVTNQFEILMALQRKHDDNWFFLWAFRLCFSSLPIGLFSIE